MCLNHILAFQELDSLKPVFQENEKSSGFEKHDPEYDRKCFAWYVKKKFDYSKIKRNQNRINIFLIFFYVSYPMKVKFMWVVISLYGRFTGLTIIFYIVSINKVITHCVYFLFNRLVSNDFKNK